MRTDFNILYDRSVKEWSGLRNSMEPVIYVGAATCGRSAGAIDVMISIDEEINKWKLRCKVVQVGCIGLCYAEPVVVIQKPGLPTVCYGNITSENAKDLIVNHIKESKIVADYALGSFEKSKDSQIPYLFDTQVFDGQTRRVLANCGIIDPTNINHYIANNGYIGLQTALSMTPGEVINKIKESGLRGRGGAGFPTWKKWTFCSEAAGDQKYIICNADEGDPGAFMNRSLLEGDPHSLIEGMLISGYAIGATEGYIYCRAEYPLALERLKNAILQATGNGFIGKNVMGSDFSFNLKIKEGAGAFVCGEETALIASIEGKRGMPSPRPPFPSNSGLWNKPTIINNVESLASVTLILRNSPEWFSEIGSEKSKGTKTFALVGKVNRTGLVEVPLGTSLKKMIFDIGGGIPGGKKFKAIQTGGPSGGCIPDNLIDLPVDYDSLNEVGTIMGSGGIVVMDEDTCMVDFARYFIEFANKESCGKCTPCRLGTRQMLDILEDIVCGRGTMEDIDLLLEVAHGVKAGSLCGLGQTAPNPVITTIKYFRNEYEEHVHQKKCRASVCKEIVSSPCQHTCPIGTEVPAYIAYIAQKEYRKAYEIILKDNPLMSVCGRVCHHPCEEHCQTGAWGTPIAIRALKRFAADWAINEKEYPTSIKYEINKEKIGIIGAGPGGLMAGYNLVKKGYDVTIFEAENVAGGAMMFSIPEYRLPKEILNLDIKNIITAGVKIKTNCMIGRDISFSKLIENYKAIIIATGAHKSKNLGIENENAEGVVDALHFLKQVSLKREVTIGKVVGVIGGGNAAIDAARTALRFENCEKVMIIYRRSEAEIPAFSEEIEAGLEEGAEIMYLTAPGKVLVEAGKVTGAECYRMILGEVDKSGRRRPVKVDNSEFIVKLDTIIVAIGEDPEIDFLEDYKSKLLNKYSWLETDQETCRTNLENVFAIGDAVTGPDTIIMAMSGGKIAAEMVDKYLTGKEVQREYSLTRPAVYVPPVDLSENYTSDSDRPEVPRITVKARCKNFDEVDLKLNEETAIREAYRCLRCDLETEDGKQALNK